MARHTLENEYDFTFSLFGLICNESEYKICAAISRQVTIELVREKSIELKGKKKDEFFQFSVFGFREELSGNSFFLINNSSSNLLELSSGTRSTPQPGLFGSSEETSVRVRGKLIPEHQDIDYFLLLDGDFSKSDLTVFKQKIQEIEIIVNCRQIEVDRLHSKNNLIF